MRKHLRISPRTSLKCRGFTLTELAIVLGVIGVILGGIWSAASHVHTEQKVDKSVQEVLAVVNGVRATYGTKGAVENIILTQQAINSGIYPADMLVQGGCTQGDATTGTCPTDAFGGQMSIGGKDNWCLTGACTTNNFQVVLWGLSASQCPAFMANMVTQGVTDGLVEIYSDAQGTTAVTAGTSMTDAHIQSCSGNIILGFTL